MPLDGGARTRTPTAMLQVTSSCRTVSPEGADPQRSWHAAVGVAHDRRSIAHVGGCAARANFAQQARSNSALRSLANHHTPALLLWWNVLLHEGSW